MTRGDFPVGGSPEAVAEWSGFASAAELEASHEQYAAEMTKAAADEAEAEAEWDESDPWAAEYDVEPEAGL